MNIVDKLNNGISVIPIPTFTTETEVLQLGMEVEATTEYVDLPQALAGRKEGCAI